MELADIDAFLVTNGLALAEYMYRRGAGFGLSVKECLLYRPIGESYFGPCREKKTRAAVVKLAQTFSIARLTVMHKAASQLRREAPITTWQLRLELAELNHLSDTELEQYAKTRVRELNATSNTRPARSLVIGRHADATGRRTAILKLPDNEMASLEKTLRTRTRNRGGTPEDIAFGNALWAMLTDGGSAAPTRLEPTVLITTDDLESCGDHELIATDGTLINATEYLADRLTEYGWAILYDKNAEPVNLWRTQRLANWKQRAIIAADQITCAWPGCDRLALYGRAHHIKAWKDGGNTNQNNLMGLCGPHNARNETKKNGRMARDHTNRAVWIPPDGGPTQTSYTRNGRSWAIERLNQPSEKT